MQITATQVRTIADEVVGAPSRLLTTRNPKVAKGAGYGYLTAILHLAPSTASGVMNTCASATAGCRAACLNTAGRGSFDESIQRARVRRTKWFKSDRAAFLAQLDSDIAAHVRSAARHGLIPAVRLNGTSDLPWENLRADFGNGPQTLFDRWSAVQFYDYTKVVKRFFREQPANYDLTFSLAESNRADADAVLAAGGRVAVVFRNADRPRALARYWTLPDSWDGAPIVDADRHDLRFLDPPAVWCGLKAKGLATQDRTGFVRDIIPGG